MTTDVTHYYVKLVPGFC